jgi:hypothetical protein
MIRTAPMKLSWVAMSAGNRLDAAFWIAVHEALLADGIDPAIATDAQASHAIGIIEARERDYGDVEPRGFF